MACQHPCLAEIQNEVDFITTATERENEKWLWKQRSIYKLPANITDLNKNAYKPQDVKAVNQLVWKFFFQKPAPSLGRCEHVLDLYRKMLLEEYSTAERHVQQFARVYKGDKDDGEYGVIRPAKELNEAGIRIQKSGKGIKFDSKTGILTVPPIVVDDDTEPLFLNAFERFHVGAKNWVTAYVFFMDCIIDDAEDISLLHSNKIVQNAFGSDEAAAKLFNSLSKEVALGKYDSLQKEIKKVNKYCERRWPRWRSYFFRTYLRNPWILVSVIAATVLFILTIIQTIYTIMSYEY